MDTNIAFGTEIKTLYDDGETMRIGAHLVLFGSADQTDISPLTKDGRGRDYFDKNTDFGLIEGKGVAPVLYHHGLNPVLKGRHLAMADLTLVDDGVWMEAELKSRDAYEKRIMQLVRQGKLGTSSGSPRDQTEREVKTNSQGETVHYVKKWPLGTDASLTPTPAEPRTMAMEIKSLEEVENFEDELIEVAVEKSEIKSVYLGEWIENDITMAGLSRLNDALMYRVVSSVLSPSDYPLSKPYDTLAQMSADERKTLVKAAFDEFQTIALDLIGRAIDANKTSEVKALLNSRYFAEKSNEASAPELKSFADHRDMALDAIRGFIGRASDIKNLREGRKSGAPVSASMREALTTISPCLLELKSVVDGILESDSTAAVKPPVNADDAPAEAAEVEAAWQKFIEHSVKAAGV